MVQKPTTPIVKSQKILGILRLRPLSLRRDCLIKYVHFDKFYLERFASINDPENWTTNVA